MTNEEVIELLKMQLSELQNKYTMLEDFVNLELGVKSPEINACALPTSYCADCGCGKKQRIEDGRS